MGFQLRGPEGSLTALDPQKRIPEVFGTGIHSSTTISGSMVLTNAVESTGAPYSIRLGVTVAEGPGLIYPGLFLPACTSELP